MPALVAQRFRRDPHAAVGYGHHDGRPDDLDRQADSSTILGVRRRVVQEIDENLRDLARVAAHFDRR